MTEVKDPLLEETEAESEESGTSTEDATLLSGLRQKRREISEARHLDLEIPGYDGDLYARYIPVEWDEVRRVADKLEKSKNPRKELYAQADVIARCCEQLMVKVKGKLIPMSQAFPELGEEPIIFDDRLAKALEFEINSHSPTRSAVLQTFNNDMAVSAQHNVVMEWIQSSTREDDQDF